ncbi:MAG: type I-B CRISPR-associated endonuclease Cas1b [Candidatus Thorarchaeota archaeon]
MKRNLYLNKNGLLKRKESTIYYITKGGKRALPVDQIKAIFAIGHVSVTSGVISFFSKMGLPLHFFGHYGYYEGSFYPRKKLVSGFAIVHQAAAYIDPARRLAIASSIVRSCIESMVAILNQYVSRMTALQPIVSDLVLSLDEIQHATNIPVLMSIEGHAWTIYYSAFDIIIKKFDMGPRVRRPPNNPVNALISFGNSLLYSTVITQIYHTQLDPSISFLHEPSARRFSLALDIAEVFKPEFVNKLIFNLLNLKTLTLDHFDQDLNYCLLNETGRQIFLSAFDKALRTTRKHPKLKRSVSNEFLIRLDCYKLLKHVTEGRPYRPYSTNRGF